VVAGGAVRILLEAAGVRDVLAKSIGSNNPINNAWATINALKKLRTVETVAQLRGKTVEEVRRGSTIGAVVVSAAVEPVQPVTAPAPDMAQALEGATE
jgi:hypothetical protein